MTRVDAEPELAGALRASGKLQQTARRRGCTAARKRRCIRLGVELDAICASGVCCLNACDARIDKHTDANALRLQTGDERLHRLHLFTRCESAIGSRRVDRVGDERCLMWARGFYNRHQVVMRVALNVEFTTGVLGEECCEWRDVG